MVIEDDVAVHIHKLRVRLGANVKWDLTTGKEPSQGEFCATIFASNLNRPSIVYYVVARRDEDVLECIEFDVFSENGMLHRAFYQHGFDDHDYSTTVEIEAAELYHARPHDPICIFTR